MAALPVMEEFQVLEDGVGQLDAGASAAAVEQFSLHPVPE
jgi:hypothetical protein